MNVQPEPAPINPVALHRTIAALLDTIAEALNEGATVAPHSIDSCGLSIWADGRALRLEITEEPPAEVDEADDEEMVAWYRQQRDRFHRWMDERRTGRTEASTDWMADTGDDIAF
jgi:hypothetical protein